MSTPKSNDIFINGRGQMIDMLKLMKPHERNKLLNNIRMQHAPLADDLSINSVGVEHIKNLSPYQIKSIFQFVQAPILGIALRGLDVGLQKKVLKIADRSYAEEAYKFMTMKLESEDRDIPRAQEKVREAITNIV